MAAGDKVAVSLAIVGYNVFQNTVLPRGAYVPSNLAAASALVAGARWRGSSWSDLGLGSAGLRDGASLGLRGAALVGGLILLAVLNPSTRGLFLDDRARDQSPGEIAFNTAIRFPMGTALFEEVAFRGVVEEIWRRNAASTTTASVADAALFAVWHLLPTGRALRGSPLGARLSSRRSRVGAVVSGAAIIGVSALALSAMRRRTGSLLAPWLAHAAFNVAGYVAGVAIWHTRRRHVAA